MNEAKEWYPDPEVPGGGSTPVSVECGPEEA